MLCSAYACVAEDFSSNVGVGGFKVSFYSIRAWSQHVSRIRQCLFLKSAFAFAGLDKVYVGATFGRIGNVYFSEGWVMFTFTELVMSACSQRFQRIVEVMPIFEMIYQVMSCCIRLGNLFFSATFLQADVMRTFGRIW